MEEIGLRSFMDPSDGMGVKNIGVITHVPTVLRINGLFRPYKVGFLNPLGLTGPHFTGPFFE